MELAVELEQSPKLIRDARKEYFESIGLTVREFVVYDNVTLKLDLELDEVPGVIVSFVKPNSDAHSGGALTGDLVKEIDGVPVESLEQALSLLGELATDASKKEFVMLVARGAETSVLRIALN